MNRALVLINPNAGRGRAEHICDEARRRTAGRVHIETLREDQPMAALAAAQERLGATAFDRLIAIGGDGSGNLAARALVEAGVEKRTAFGLVPAGTGSDFVRGLEPRARPVERLERLLLSSETAPCDLIEARTASGARLFSLNVASAGLSSAVNEKMNRRERHGGSSYLLLTLSALITYQPYHCRVEADGQPTFDGPVFLVAIANGRFFGKGMMVAPEASIDDGWLDLVVVPPIAKWKLPWRLPRFLTGQHLRYEEVIYRRAREVRFEPAPGLPSYDLDGDPQPAETVTFRALAGKLRLVV